jgi:hypothetical protein
MEDPPVRTNPIRADQFWNDTGVDLIEGASYRLSVAPGLGEPLRDASFEARSIDGEDWQSLAHKSAELLHGKRVDDAKWFALIGTVDKRHPWVLRDKSRFTAPASGRLYCFFNDVQLELFYRNNSGWVVLEIDPVGL